MATLFSLEHSSTTPKSEKKVATSFKSLGDAWTVFHHICWQSFRAGKQADGEADFVIVHPKKGALVVEVKGGGIDIQRGRWRSTNSQGEIHLIKDPYEQATDSKHALVRWLKNEGFSHKLRVGHAVAFPDLSRLPALGPNCNEKITLLKTDLLNPEEAVERCVSYWQLQASMSPSDTNKLVSRLAPTTHVTPNLLDQSKEAELGLTSLTDDQLTIFAGLKASRGGVVLGSAGTGKTTLAVARALELAKNGFRTAIVCYNELLGQELKACFKDSDNVVAGTFHSLCFHEAHKAGIDIPQDQSQDWWETKAVDLLLDACQINAQYFDAIVIDEGQDFSPLWIDGLRFLVNDKKDAPFFVFADPLQDIWKRDWDQTLEFPFSYTLTQNLRNTAPIANRVAATVQQTPNSCGISGPSPRWRTAESQTSLLSLALDEVESLLDQGFEAHDIVVLCASRTLSNRLRERSICSFSFGQWKSNGIAVETISRFKGLESQAVVLLLDMSDSDYIETVAYVGMSRARTVLSVIGTQSKRTLANWS